MRNNYIDKMNILQFQQQQPQQLFDNDHSQDFSIEEQTEQLINEVFNKKYDPVYNPPATKNKEDHYRQLKKKENVVYKKKLRETMSHKIYQNVEDKGISPSFSGFLLRAQQRIDSHTHWLNHERTKKEQRETRIMKEVPDILRGSREKLQPIYQRCIDLQKEKQKKREVERIKKSRKEAEEVEKITFQPEVNRPKRDRTFQEYIADKQIWQRLKEQEIEKQRVAVEVSRLSQCTFKPQLVSRYYKHNPRIIPGEPVEYRLLRSLERSISKDRPPL